jgi:hypothetical protein
MHSAWAEQFPLLATAYLQWKSSTLPRTTERPAPVHQFHVKVMGIQGVYSFYYLVSYVNLFSLEYDDLKTVDQQADEMANVSLISIGLLGCSPVDPTTAFTLETLELYHRIRRQQGSFSVQAMTKVLCSLNNVSLGLLCFKTHSFTLFTLD